MAGERGEVATVFRQEGDRVLLSVPMVGFPPGFKLRKGERVVLVQEESGAAVRPLVRARVAPAAVAKRRSFELDDQSYKLQAATVSADAPGEAEAAGEEYVVWTVDPGEAEGAEQVIAVRPR